MNKSKGMKQGFSLIEVIVAVAILAVLSLPILLYFTNAAVKSAKGRHEQAADVAAQSVIEEIDAVKGFSKLENELVGSYGWTAASDPDDSSDSFALKKDISIDYDGNGTKEFTARVVLDYGVYVATGGAAHANSFNSYNNPHLPEVYDDKNIVFSESDESEVAVYDLYQKFNGSSASEQSNGTEKISLANIKTIAERKFNLTIREDTADNDYCFVKGGILMSCDPSSVVSSLSAAVSDVSIKVYRVKKTDLKNVYFLFKPMDGSSVSSLNPYGGYGKASSAQGIFDFDEKYEDLSISFIRQNSYVGDTKAVSPGAVEIIDAGGRLNSHGQAKIDDKITITASGPNTNWAFSKFYANSNIVISGAPNAKSADQIQKSKDKNGDEGNLWMVSSPQEKRIAKVHVYIFEKNGYSDSKVDGYLAEAITSKSN